MTTNIDLIEIKNILKQKNLEIDESSFKISYSVKCVCGNKFIIDNDRITSAKCEECYKKEMEEKNREDWNRYLRIKQRRGHYY